MPPLSCATRFELPTAPLHGNELNGVALDDVCFVHAGPYHVFAIGDWGGVVAGLPESAANPDTVPRPADHRSAQFPAFRRKFVVGVDDRAQLRVRDQMEKRALETKPDYVLNVGDNFYWAGVEARCGSPPFWHLNTGQWRSVFENVYAGEGLAGRQWLGVLGNHDYGGYKFTSAWDQTIGYSWARLSTNRWVVPAQYWKVRVWYPDFSIDYFFVDTNVFAVGPPDADSEHNICSREHNGEGATCGPQGPEGVDACPGWFEKLWKDQISWMTFHIPRSRAEWQIVVTHFPPEYGSDEWRWMARAYGIDIIVTGHKHLQQVWGPEQQGNILAPTAVIVTGGGGGVTSAGVPDLDGNDDQYGFVDMAFSRELVTVELVSHGGQVRSTTHVRPRPRDDAMSDGVPGNAKRAPQWPFAFTTTFTETSTTVTTTVTTTTQTSTTSTSSTTTSTTTTTSTSTSTSTTSTTETHTSTTITNTSTTVTSTTDTTTSLTSTTNTTTVTVTTTTATTSTSTVSTSTTTTWVYVPPPTLPPPPTIPPPTLAPPPPAWTVPKVAGGSFLAPSPSPELVIDDAPRSKAESEAAEADSRKFMGESASDLFGKLRTITKTSTKTSTTRTSTTTTTATTTTTITGTSTTETSSTRTTSTTTRTSRTRTATKTQTRTSTTITSKTTTKTSLMDAEWSPMGEANDVGMSLAG